MLKEALEKLKDNSANVQDKELSNAKLYKVLLRFISTKTKWSK